MTMIREIRLKDWKSHQDTHLDFSNGVNVLVGEMGSGKSSVLEAMTYALYGELPAVRERKISLDDLIRRSPTKAKKARVELTFTSDGDEYRVERELTRDKGTTESKLYHEGDLIAGPQTSEVSARIAELLGIDFELFTQIIYSQQNELDFFLTLQPSERKEKIDQLLKLDRFEDARSNLVKLNNRVKGRYEDRTEDLEDLKEQYDPDERDELEETIDELDTTIDDLQEQREEKQERKDKIKEAVEELNEKKEQYRRLDRQKTRAEAQIESLDEEIEQMESRLDLDVETREEAKSAIKEVEDQLQEIKEKQEALQEIEKDIRVRESKKEDLEDRIKELESQHEQVKDLDGLEDTIQDLQEQRDKVNDQISQLQAGLAQVKDALEQLSTSHNTCPTCGKELTDEHRVSMVKQNREEKEAKEEQIAELQERKDEIEGQLDKKNERREKLLQYQGVDEKIEERQEEIREGEEKLQEALETKEEIEEQLKDVNEEQLRERKEALEDVIELQEKRTAIEEKQEALETIQEKIAEINFDEDELEDRQEQLSELRSDLKVLENKIYSKQQLIEEKKKRLQDLNDREDRIEDLNEEIDRLDTHRDFLDHFNRSLEETQQEMRATFIDRVNDVMHKIWETIYPYDDYSSINLRAGEDYILMLQEDQGDWVPVEGEVSGGERHSASLTLRIALAMVLAPDLRLLILDEPTHNLDSRAIDDLAQTLRTQVADLVEQLFLITHEEELETAVTANLYTLSKQESRQGITAVEEHTQ